MKDSLKLSDKEWMALILLAKRHNPNNVLWLSYEDKFGNALSYTQTRCLICEKIILHYEVLICHARDHLREKGLLVFL